MSSATEDFLLGMAGLESAASRLTSPAIGGSSSRSAEYLQLNGLHVVAFALLEDFLRRRTLEILVALGKAKVRFDSFPDGLKLQILQETFKGIGFFISRKTSENKVDTLLVEALSIYTAADEKSDFVPSDFCFGKSQSNISLSQIITFLEAFGVSVTASLSKILERIQFEHLGSPEVIFSRLSDNRNMAAHAFNLNFNLVEFLSDVRAGFRILAFLYDTILSHSAFNLREAVFAGEPYRNFLAESICLKSIRFDSLKKEWKVVRQTAEREEEQDPIKEKSLNSKLDSLKKSKHDKDDTIYIVNSGGVLQTWLQPI
jgi:hypothetical protein